MNYQFITGVLLARETPVLLDGSLATRFSDRRAECVDGPKRNGGTHAHGAGAGAGGGRNTKPQKIADARPTPFFSRMAYKQVHRANKIGWAWVAYALGGPTERERERARSGRHRAVRGGWAHRD